MSRDRYSSDKRKRTTTRRKRTASSAAFSAGTQRSRRGARHRSTVSGARQYHSATSGALPRLRLQAVKLNASRFVALFLVGLMIALLVWFFVDERFYVYAADVRGNSLVTADEVYQASGLHSMSIFYIDHDKVAQDITHRLPSVTQVHVQCELPSRVSIRVSEEDVRYIWRLADAAFLADAKGRILKVDDGAHVGLVVVQDLDNSPVRPGDQVDHVALSAAGRLHGLLPDVQVFEYSKAHGVSLSDARGWQVYFGDDERLAEKVATLQALLLKMEQEHRSARVIDLRYAGSPYYR